MPDLVPGLLEVIAPPGNVELIANSATYQRTSGSQTTTFTLPDARNVFVGRFFTFINSSSAPVIVKYFDGRQAMVVASNTSRQVTLTQRSSAAGGWIIGPSTTNIYSQITAYGAVTVQEATRA